MNTMNSTSKDPTSSSLKDLSFNIVPETPNLTTLLPTQTQLFSESSLSSRPTTRVSCVNETLVEEQRGRDGVGEEEVWRPSINFLPDIAFSALGRFLALRFPHIQVLDMPNGILSRFSRVMNTVKSCAPLSILILPPQTWQVVWWWFIKQLYNFRFVPLVHSFASLCSKKLHQQKGGKTWKLSSTYSHALTRSTAT